MKHASVNVLLVEDNAVDREGVARAFSRHRIANPIHHANDGIEALDILRGTNGRDKLGRPFVVLLDINMPRMNGIELLQEIRADECLKDSVVFMLTTSRSEQDKMASYGLNVAGYMVKEDVGDDFLRLVAMLDHYWRIVELPSGEV
ncbi:MAG: response regulator [Myxococcales bacterium]|nr:response regulator [Myxococcales bacterium]MCB9581924.1 response regulator [Polyangiaceae bacterium]